MVTAAVAPPAISGGTLRVLSDGRTAVAADPDRDRVYVVDLSARTVARDGGVASRATNRAAWSRTPPAASTSRSATAAPRQLRPAPGATDRPAARGLRRAARPRLRRGADLVHVACADGELVSLPAAGGAAVRTLQLRTRSARRRRRWVAPARQPLPQRASC